jgi:cytochrome P450
VSPRGTTVATPDAAAELDRSLLADTFFEDPYAVYARLRDVAPVHWSPALDAWLVAGHPEALAVLRDPERFSSFGWELRYLERLPEAVRAEIPELLVHHQTPNIITSDPPLHTRLRRSVMRGFTPRALEPLRPRLAALAEELLEPGRRRGSIDIVGELAYPLPAIVIADLLGVPSEDRDRFKAWSSSMTRFFGTGHPDVALAARAERDIHDFRAWLMGLIVARRREPRDDVVSILVSPDETGAVLTDDELLATLVIFLVAGHETTTNLIANGLYALLRHPDQLDAVRAETARLPDAVEEMLRYDPPVQRVRRRALVDVEIAGTPVGAGQTVMVLLASANRDPRAFGNPDAFDVSRVRAAHLAFGNGIHFCLGAGLARLEAPIAIAAILEMSPGIELDESWTPRWNRSMTLRGLVDLPVRLA